MLTININRDDPCQIVGCFIRHIGGWLGPSVILRGIVCPSFDAAFGSFKDMSSFSVDLRLLLSSYGKLQQEFMGHVYYNQRLFDSPRNNVTTP